MPTSPERRAFILQEFRVEKAESAPMAAIFGGDARKTEEPVQTNFNSMEDVAAVLAQRSVLLMAVRRRFAVEVNGVETGLALDAPSKVATARLIDPTHAADMPMMVVSVGPDFQRNKTTLGVWG